MNRTRFTTSLRLVLHYRIVKLIKFFSCCVLRCNYCNVSLNLLLIYIYIYFLFVLFFNILQRVLNPFLMISVDWWVIQHCLIYYFLDLLTQVSRWNNSNIACVRYSLCWFLNLQKIASLRLSSWISKLSVCNFYKFLISLRCWSKTEVGESKMKWRILR